MKITAYLSPRCIEQFLKGEQIDITYANEKVDHQTIQVEFDREETDIAVMGGHVYVQIFKWED